MNKIIVNLLGERFLANAEKKAAGKISYNGAYWDACKRYNETMKLVEADEDGYVPMDKEIESIALRYPNPNMQMITSIVIRNTPKKIVFTPSYAAARDLVYQMLSGASYVETTIEICGKCTNRGIHCGHCKYKNVPSEIPEIVVCNVFEPRRVTIKNTQDWADTLALEKAKKRDYAISKQRELDAQVLLQTPCRWLGYETLNELNRCFDSFEDFMDYVDSVNAAILREGCWDNDTPIHDGFVDARSVYSSVYQGEHVEDHGKRITHVYGQGKTFTTTIVTDSDKLTQFLSLTFYKAVGMEPMAKMAMKSCKEDHGYGLEGSMKLVVMDPEDEFTEEYFRSSELVTTPIYVTPKQMLKQYSNGVAINPEVRYELPQTQIVW